MNVLLLGAGRAGLRHLAGLTEAGGRIHVVDRRPEAEADVRRVAEELGLRVTFQTSPADVSPEAFAGAAILATTAGGRLDQLELLAERGVRDVLVEKPLEQSRARVRRMLDVAAATGLSVHVHLHRRSNPVYRSLRDAGGPFRVVVTGGAFGLACNGIHYLDLARFLARDEGRLLFAEIEPVAIGSGRGTAFRDYGGRGLFGYEDGTRLYLESWADSSAPELVTVVHDSRASFFDGFSALVYERGQDANEPVYRYGLGYSRTQVEDFETLRGGETTRRWIGSLQGRGDTLLPTLEEAAPAHELLFDLLETSGETEFPIA